MYPQIVLWILNSFGTLLTQLYLVPFAFACLIMAILIFYKSFNM